MAGPDISELDRLGLPLISGVSPRSVYGPTAAELRVFCASTIALLFYVWHQYRAAHPIPKLIGIRESQLYCPTCRVWAKSISQ